MRSTPSRRLRCAIAIFSAASEAHADAAAVLAEAPNTIARPSPGGDGGDFRDARRGGSVLGHAQARARGAGLERAFCGAFGSSRSSRRSSGVARREAVAVTSRLGLKRALTATELAFIIAERVATDDRARRLLVDARVAPGDSGVCA